MTDDQFDWRGLWVVDAQAREARNKSCGLVVRFRAAGSTEPWATVPNYEAVASAFKQAGAINVGPIMDSYVLEAACVFYDGLRESPLARAQLDALEQLMATGCEPPLSAAQLDAVAALTGLSPQALASAGLCWAKESRI